MTTYKCASPKCSNSVEDGVGYFGMWCKKCQAEIFEAIFCMEQPPSFFWRVYDFIATKIDELMFNIEYIHDKRKYRKKIRKNKE